MRNVKVRGIVLREAEYGEGDKILTVFSDEIGIISIRARRAKRQGFKYLASVQTFAYSDFELFRGSTMYSLNSAALIEPFYNLRNDLDVLTVAGKMCRLTSFIIHPEQPEVYSLRLLLNTLYFLNKGTKNPLLLHDIYRIRLLSLQGYEPLLNSCALCSTPAEGQDLVFSINEKSICCSDCAKKNIANYIDIDYDVLAALIYICNSTIEKLFNITVSEQVEKVLDYISGMLVKSCLEK